MDGERFIASGPFLKIVDIARILKKHLGEDARKVQTRVLPDLLVRLAALFDPLVKAVVGELGSVRNLDANHARSVLDWVARPAEESILDTARSLIALGLVKG
jgi:dihydroflavonol-4-reductase